MALTAKSAYDKERQEMFDELRHLIASKHQVPEHLGYHTIREFIEAFKNYKEDK